MRIGICFLSVGIDIFAGIENSLYNLAKGLVSAGASVHFYSGLLSGTETTLDGIPVFRSCLLPSKLPMGDDTVRAALSERKDEIREEIGEFVDQRQLDVLYVCDPLWGVAQNVEAWKKVSVPMILSLRVLNTIDLLHAAYSAPFRLYTAVSDSLREEVLQHVMLSPFITLPNSVDTESFCPREPSTDSRIILCNARISPEKGILDLVRSFPAVLAVYPDAELWLCSGDFPFGDRREYLHQVDMAITSLSISPSIRFLPKLEWSGIPDMIRQARVVVVPSLRETFGRAALEAMACGIPVVSTRAGNLPDLLAGAGVLTDAVSPDQLSSAIINVLENDTLYQSMRQRGLEQAQLYSNTRIAKMLISLCDGL